MRSTTLFTLLAGAALAVPPVYAEAPEEGAQVIEEITVTARRREETVQEVPIPVTALGGEALRDRAADDLTDLTRLTPNMNFGMSGVSRNTANVFLRGIGQVNWAPSQDPKIGTYVDGVYLGRPQGGVFDFMDIDRVEVLRGPQGTLFGRNTTAGLVHVISNRPTNEFDYSVGAGIGNDNARRVEGMVNLPLNDVLAARLAFQSREADGYVRNVGAGEDWGDENSMSARVSFRWTPNDRAHADLVIEAYRADETALLGACEWGGPPNGADTAPFTVMWAAWVFNVYDELRNACIGTSPYRSNDNDPDSSSDAETYSATLDLSVDLGFADLTSITSFRDLTSYNGSWGWGTDAVGTVSLIEVLGTTDDDGEQWSQEFRLSGIAMNDRLDWVIGVYAFEENNVINLDVPLLRGAVPPDCAVWPVFCAPSGIPGLPLGILVQSAFQAGGSRNQNMGRHQRLAGGLRRGHLEVRGRMVPDRRRALLPRQARVRARRFAVRRRRAHSRPQLPPGSRAGTQRHDLLRRCLLHRSHAPRDPELGPGGQRDALLRLEQGVLERRLQPGREHTAVRPRDLRKLGRRHEVDLGERYPAVQHHGLPQHLREPADHREPHRERLSDGGPDQRPGGDPLRRRG